MQRRRSRRRSGRRLCNWRDRRDWCRWALRRRRRPRKCRLASRRLDCWRRLRRRRRRRRALWWLWTRWLLKLGRRCRLRDGRWRWYRRRYGRRRQQPRMRDPRVHVWQFGVSALLGRVGLRGRLWRRCRRRLVGPRPLVRHTEYSCAALLRSQRWLPQLVSQSPPLWRREFKRTSERLMMGSDERWRLRSLGSSEILLRQRAPEGVIVVHARWWSAETAFFRRTHFVSTFCVCSIVLAAACWTARVCRCGLRRRRIPW